MARVKGAMMTRKRRNKVLKLAKGYWGAKSKHSLPNCIIKAASAGVAIPPAAKLTTGSFPFSQTYSIKS